MDQGVLVPRPVCIYPLCKSTVPIKTDTPGLDKGKPPPPVLKKNGKMDVSHVKPKKWKKWQKSHITGC